MRTLLIGAFSTFFFGSPALAVSILGSSSQFAVLSGAAVTNTGATTIIGDLGGLPPGSITGDETITLTGTIQTGNAVAQLAHADASQAFTALNEKALTTDLTGQDLGTVGVLTPGVYRFSSSAQLTGNLVLDFAGNPDGAFVFQIGTALTTATASSITVLNGGARSGIFFAVGSSATLGTDTVFAGNILASQAITLNTGVRLLCGRAIALVAAVTLANNVVANDCTGGLSTGGRSDFGSFGFSGENSAAAVPEPATWLLLIGGFGGIGVAMRSARYSSRAATMA